MNNWKYIMGWGIGFLSAVICVTSKLNAFITCCIGVGLYAIFYFVCLFLEDKK